MSNSLLSRRRFLGSLGAAAGAIGCASAKIMPAPWPNLADFDACRAEQSLSILTWNVFMMPTWIHESPSNEARAAAIATTLLEQRFDIVCLQKVFDPGARAVLERSLALQYPYRWGPANNSCSLKIGSGVWVLSRHPLIDYHEIQFDECSSWECFSRKGALLVSGTCNGMPFRLVTTHLQGEESDHFTAKNEAIRYQQVLEIRNKLLIPFLQPSIPFVICGDFGIPRLMDDGSAETVAYRRMLAALNAENGPDVRLTLIDDASVNGLAGTSGRRNELDYILLCNNGAPIEAARTRYVFKRKGWDKERDRSDLSYRYAVGAHLTFGQRLGEQVNRK